MPITPEQFREMDRRNEANKARKRNLTNENNPVSELQNPVTERHQAPALGEAVSGEVTCETGCDTLQKEMRENQITYVCKTCGKEMACSPSRNRKYCSTSCAYESPERVAHVKPIDRGVAKCSGCGATFQLRTGGGKKYCSQICAAKTIGKKTMAENRVAMPIIKKISKACRICGKQFKYWESSGRIYCSQKCSADDPDAKTKRVKTSRANGGDITSYSRSNKQWLELGGQRLFCRSSWEANYARYLEWMKSQQMIEGWEHEPKTFWFENIKRGVRSYLPDFRVDLKKGGHEWHEVKGWMDSKSKTKIKRMAKYFPDEVLRVIDSPWFKDANRKLAGIIPGWTNRGASNSKRSKSK